MGNSFIDSMKQDQNYTFTENGALAHKSTMDKVYDMFAFGGAYRKRSDEDIILLFKEAFEADPKYAMRCLFYLRDVRGGGQGERRFFRVAYKWLCNTKPKTARKYLKFLPEYGRWDDLIYSCEGTPMEENAFELIARQLVLDTQCKTPSLLGKWMPSENCSSIETKRVAHKLRTFMKLDHKQYRKILSNLRARINVLETLMSANRWDEIEFDKIPSKAGLIYKNAFARRDLIAKKYESFIKDKDTTVNAKTLYPYEVVEKALSVNKYLPIGHVEREAVEKYWVNLLDYFNGSDRSILAVVDTSGSMCGRPMDIAIGLGIYAGERSKGAFQNHYISFASKPQLIEIRGVDFVDKVRRIYETNLCDNTNLVAVFDLLFDMVLSGKAKAKDLPDSIVVISDMEIDSMTGSWVPGYGRQGAWTEKTAATEMEKVRAKWASFCLKVPKLVYWNVDARSNVILDSGPNVTFVSGASPVLFEQVVRGVSGIDLMLEKLNSSRYSDIN